jgi:hypothetical protein
MGCLLPILAVFMPRLVMVFILLLTNWFNLAFQTVLWPLLGFFFMPYTTLAYMGAMINNHHEVTGVWLVLLIVAVFFDLGGQGHSARSGRVRYRRA